MTISQAFVKLLEEKGYGVFGQNIFLYRVPNSLKVDTELIWVIPSGGQTVRNNSTGEMIKAYQFLVYYRSDSARRVDEALAALESELNCSKCVKLQGFELVNLETTQYPVSQDLDSENRMVGILQVQVQVYKGCEES